MTGANWWIVLAFTIITAIGTVAGLSILYRVWQAEKDRIRRKLNGRLKMLIRKRAKLYGFLTLSLAFFLVAGIILLLVPPPGVGEDRLLWVAIAFICITLGPIFLTAGLVVDFLASLEADRVLNIGQPKG